MDCSVFRYKRLTNGDYHDVDDDDDDDGDDGDAAWQWQIVVIRIWCDDTVKDGPGWAIFFQSLQQGDTAQSSSIKLRGWHRLGLNRCGFCKMFPGSNGHMQEVLVQAMAIFIHCHERTVWIWLQVCS